MNLAPSSTAVEVRPPGRRFLTGSTEAAPTELGVVSVSAQTATIAFARNEDFRATLENGVADSSAVMTRRSAEHTGWLMFSSPTLRFTVDLVDLIRGSVLAERPEYERSISVPATELPAATTFRVVDPGAGVYHVKPEPGLLSSTDVSLGISELVESKFAEAVASAGQEWFEDGIESRFSRALSALLHAYGDTVVSAMETYLSSPDVNTEVAVDTAQWLGEVEHPASYHYRRSLLERLLMMATSSTRVRYGAAAGLAAMDDYSSLLVVIQARDREGNRRLRHFLELVVDQLERTRACRSS